jgi:N-acetylneuraminate lyase
VSFALIAAPHTPFRPDGSLDLPAIDRQADHLRRHRLDGAFVCGTTGEGTSLTCGERKSVAERWAGAGLPITVHVGHASQAEAAELARHAAGLCIAGIASVFPYYPRPATEDAAVDWLAGVAAAAPGVPFTVYDIPAATGVRLRTDIVMKLAADRIPTFAGVKFSNPDLSLLQECLATGHPVRFGCDEMLLAAVALGVTGAVGSTYNFMPGLYRRMLAAAAANDWPTARMLQRRALAVVRVLDRFGGLAAGKAAMALAGVECGPVRPPLVEPDRAALRQALDAVGFFEMP